MHEGPGRRGRFSCWCATQPQSRKCRCGAVPYNRDLNRLLYKRMKDMFVPSCNSSITSFNDISGKLIFYLWVQIWNNSFHFSQNQELTLTFQFKVIVRFWVHEISFELNWEWDPWKMKPKDSGCSCSFIVMVLLCVWFTCLTFHLPTS